MFTGIIEELGSIVSLNDGRLRVGCRAVLEDAKLGSSIAVNGVCLTAVELLAHEFSADLAPETLRRTNLGDVRPGSRVNLERPLAAGGRLNGHIVQGHVDGVGELVTLEALGNENWWLRIRIPEELRRYLVFKGSIAIDGISLTVAAVEDDCIAITIVPHTYTHTNLGTRRPGDRINIETDILAKYVERLLPAAQSGLTLEKMRQMGY